MQFIGCVEDREGTRFKDVAVGCMGEEGGSEEGGVEEKMLV